MSPKDVTYGVLIDNVQDAIVNQEEPFDHEMVGYYWEGSLFYPSLGYWKTVASDSYGDVPEILKEEFKKQLK